MGAIARSADRSAGCVEVLGPAETAALPEMQARVNRHIGRLVLFRSRHAVDRRSGARI
jgi:hypothetical protein